MVKKKNIKFNKKVKLVSFILSLIIVLILFLSYNYFFSDKEYHTHADFKVYLNGEFINFSQDKYQSIGFNVLAESVHLHDSNGNVIHYHEKGIKLSDFFLSLNMNFTNNCFIDDLNISYCNNENYKLKTFVNGKEIQDAPNYISKDLDRILIVYTDETTDINYLLDNVTDEACIQSALCPDRGEPSEGSCITGKACAVDLNQFE